MKLFFHKILDRLGYYCYGCGKYKKRFNPPFGRDVCLECQLNDADNRNRELRVLNNSWKRKNITEVEFANRIELLRNKYLASRSERKVDNEA